MKTLKDLKVGDEVFVVQQKSRYQKTEARTSTETISKVGRQYAYFMDGRWEQKFCRETGQSAHKEWNTRANGHGFDVYLNEEDYHRKQFEAEEFKRLEARLVRFSNLRHLPPDAVEQIHNILDANGME